MRVSEVVELALLALNVFPVEAILAVGDHEHEETVGVRVRRARLRRGWTRKQLSARLGYQSLSTLSHIENDRYKEGGGPHDETLIRIAEVTGCDILWLADGIGDGP